MSTSQHNNTTTPSHNIFSQHLNLLLIIDSYKHWIVVAWCAESHLAELQLAGRLVTVLSFGLSVVGPVHVGEHAEQKEQIMNPPCAEQTHQ